MRSWGLVLLFVLWPATASADVLLEGHVMDAHARWTDTGNTIITESNVLTQDGQLVSVWQGGGIVGDTGVWFSHSPPLLVPGDWVRLDLRGARRGPGVTGLAAGDSLQIARVIERVSRVGGARSEGRAFFAPSLNEEGAELHWAIRDFEIIYNQAGTSQLAGESEFDEVDKAFNEWQARSVECGTPAVDDPMGAPVELVRFDTTKRADQETVSKDGLNVVVFRDEEWCRPIGEGKTLCHSPQAAAITCLSFVVSGDQSGEIRDADIEFNGVDFLPWIEGMPESDVACEAEVANTMAHEIGHFLGLDHTCWTGTGNRPNDDNGVPVPLCEPAEELAPEIVAATMYAFQDCADVDKKVLSDDDVAFVCEAYPPLPPLPDGCGCGRDGTGSVGCLLFLAALLGSRRRATCRT